jgi:hypothetical protein
MKNRDRYRMNAGLIDKKQKLEENVDECIIKNEEAVNRLSNSFMNMYRDIQGLKHFTTSPDAVVGYGLYATHSLEQPNPQLRKRLYELAKAKLKKLALVIEEELGEHGHRDEKERDERE